MGLNPKQQVFVERYLVHFNAKKAYIEAYGPKTTHRTAEVEGSKFLRKPEILAQIEQGQAEIKKRNVLDQDWVISRLMAIGDSNISKLASVTEKGISIRPDVDECDLRGLSSITIKSYSGEKGNSEETKITMRDPGHALEKLGKHIGMWEVQVRVIDQTVTEESRKRIRDFSERVFQVSLKRLLDQKQDELAKLFIHIRCYDNIESFTNVFFPHYAKFPYNTFHQDYFDESKTFERGLRRAWASPRGSAKSTVVTLVKPIHDVCYDLEKFILIISSTDDLAIGKLKDIRDEVLTNRGLQDVYGLAFETKKPGAEQFVIYSDIAKTYFVARGSGAQIRGIRFGPHRPSKVILDDLEHSERVYSPLQRQKTENYFKEDVGKVGDEETTIEMVGTVLHRQSLLNTLLSNPAYFSKKYKSIIKWPDNMDLWNKWEEIAMDIGNDNRITDSDKFYEDNKEAMDAGAVIMWPEKESLLYLFKEKLEIGRRSWFKEKQNEPLGADDRVFENIWWYKSSNEGITIEKTGEFIPWKQLLRNSYGALDPATGQTKPSSRKLPDFACLGIGYEDKKGRMFVHKDWTKRRPPSKQIDAIFDFHDVHKFQKFGVETNLYRELLLKNIIEERKRREKREKTLIKIPFYDIVNTENKDKRIHTMEPKVSHGWILFNRDLTAEFQNQLLDYPFVEHDDCLDMMEMLWMLANNAYKASPLSMSAAGGI